jgi:hypothetical protein
MMKHPETQWWGLLKKLCRRKGEWAAFCLVGGFLSLEFRYNSIAFNHGVRIVSKQPQDLHITFGVVNGHTHRNHGEE